MRTVFKQCAHEKKAFHDRAIERLNAQAAKLRNRLDQIYLDKLDGEIDESFYRIHVPAWRKEHDQTLDRIRRHQKVNENYIDQGIRLLDLARNALEFFRIYGRDERAILLRYILQGSTFHDGKTVAAFKSPFDIIQGLTAYARQADLDTKKQAASTEATCLFRLPRTDSNCRPAG